MAPGTVVVGLPVLKMVSGSSPKQIVFVTEFERSNAKVLLPVVDNTRISKVAEETQPAAFSTSTITSSPSSKL